MRSLGVTAPEVPRDTGAVNPAVFLGRVSMEVSG